MHKQCAREALISPRGTSSFARQAHQPRFTVAAVDAIRLPSTIFHGSVMRILDTLRILGKSELFGSDETGEAASRSAANTVERGKADRTMEGVSEILGRWFSR